ncbi:MAG TPA: 3D domain-containing protein [Bryobacteraceae bacterium]|nr:3D domain-containing protein [Bryobacteraceae bacterium]
MERRSFLLLLGATPVAAAPRERRRHGRYRALTFVATAHSIRGKTASGSHAKPGTAAADPKVLPLGTRIHVIGAGAYSRGYTITDTGPAVRGRRIDLYMASYAEARKFGRQRVKVIVLKRGKSR